jgi:hypothetical protein
MGLSSPGVHWIPTVVKKKKKKNRRRFVTRELGENLETSATTMLECLLSLGKQMASTNCLFILFLAGYTKVLCVLYPEKKPHFQGGKNLTPPLPKTPFFGG